MMSASPLRMMTCFASLIVLCTTSLGWTGDAVTLLGVQVSPDGQIILKSDGTVSKHNAFIMQSPNRLVMDFEDTRIGKMPAHFKIDRDPIREIRLGHKDARTRVVVDFGSHTVPPFKVHRQDKAVIVAFEPGSVGVQGKPPFPTQTMPLRMQAGPQALNGRPDFRKPATASQPTALPARQSTLSDLVVKTSGTKDDLVFVELADRRDPTRTYRLVVDVDKSGSKVRNVTLSDAQGNLRRFDTGARSLSENSSTSKVTLNAGPRKGIAQAERESAVKPKFQWGMDAVRRDEPEEGLVAVQSPFSTARNGTATR